jgi:TonB-dependent Receptor Plug Domain/CarboxypepD_reg-like domain
MKSKIIAIALLLGNLCLPAYSQYTLKGIILDADTKEALFGATILFESGIEPMVADLNGKFKVSTGLTSIGFTIQYVGFKSQYHKVDLTKQKSVFEILLAKDANLLNEVEVVANTVVQDLNRPILGVNSLNIKTINKLPTALGETDILKGLQMLPGVSSVGEASNGLNIRGGTTDQNLILLDNAPIFNPTHMFGLFSAFPSDGISSLELYKGNIPAKYGGRSASVLDISLKNPSLHTFSMNGGISVVSEKLSVELPLIKDKLGLMIAGRASFNDFVLPIISPKFREMKSNFGDVAAKMFFKVNSKNTLALGNYQSYDFFQTELLGSVDNLNAEVSQYKYKTNNTSLKWNLATGKTGYFETVLVHAIYQPDILFPELTSSNKIEVNQGIQYNEAKTAYKFNLKNHLLDIGLDAVKYAINPGRLEPNASTSVSAKTSQKEFGLETAAFISDEFKVGNSLEFSAGLRYSFFSNLGPTVVRKYEIGQPLADNNVISEQKTEKNKIAKSYGGLEPRLGIRLALSDRTNLKFGYNVSRQYLQQISNTTTPLPTSRWKLSDTHIHPQVSQLYALGLTQDTKNKTFQLGLEVYYRSTAHVVDYKPGANFFLKDFPETELLQGVNKSYGIEIMASKEKGSSTGWLNYTYARSLNKVSGPSEQESINNGVYYPANYDRPHTLNASIIIGQGKHHDFSFNFTYSTGRPFTSPQGYIEYNNNLLPYYGDRNNQRIPAYHRLDFAWNIYNPKMNEKKRFKGNWAFSVYNLYGQKNAYSVFYRAENKRLNPYKLVIFGSPIPSLAYKFKIG